MIVLSDFKEPDSVIKLQQNGIKAVMDHKELGIGTLYITESLLSWQGPHGFSIPYPNISMHAISKDPSLYPTDCLYVMIDKHIKLEGLSNGDDVNGDGQSDDNDSDNESDSEISELIFVPDDKSALAQMYEAIKQCQELHPDPADVSTDEDEAFEDMMEDQAEENGDEEGDVDRNGDIYAENMQMQNLTLNENQDLNGFRHVNNHNHMEDEEQEQFQDAD